LAIDRLAFRNLIEFYLPLVEKNDAFIVTCNEDISIENGLGAFLKCSRRIFQLPIIHFLN